jgi:hypothetical protein
MVFWIRIEISQVTEETEGVKHKDDSPSSAGTRDNTIILDEEPQPLGTTHDEGMKIKELVDLPVEDNVSPPTTWCLDCLFSSCLYVQL